MVVECVNMRTKEVNVAVNIRARHCRRAPDSVHAHDGCVVRPAHSPDDQSSFSLAPYSHCLGMLMLQCYILDPTVPPSPLYIPLTFSCHDACSGLQPGAICCCFPRFSRVCVEYQKELLYLPFALFMCAGEGRQFPEQTYTPNNIVLQYLRLKWTFMLWKLGWLFLFFFVTLFLHSTLLQIYFHSLNVMLLLENLWKSHWNSSVYYWLMLIIYHICTTFMIVSCHWVCFRKKLWSVKHHKAETFDTLHCVSDRYFMLPNTMKNKVKESKRKCSHTYMAKC